MGPPLYRAMASVATPAPATRWERIRDFHLRLLRTPSLRWVGRSALIVNEAYDLPNVEAPWNIAAMPTPRPDAQVRAFVVRNVEFRTPVDVIEGTVCFLLMKHRTPHADVQRFLRCAETRTPQEDVAEGTRDGRAHCRLASRGPSASSETVWRVARVSVPGLSTVYATVTEPPAPPPSSQTRMSMDDGIEYLETVVEEAVTDSEEEARRRKLTSDVEMKDGEREETLPELVEEEVAGWRVLTERLRPRKQKGPPRGYSSSETAVENRASEELRQMSPLTSLSDLEQRMAGKEERVLRPMPRVDYREPRRTFRLFNRRRMLKKRLLADLTSSGSKHVPSDSALVLQTAERENLDALLGIPVEEWGSNERRFVKALVTSFKRALYGRIGGGETRKIQGM
ncbi:hypothetical protein A0H81_11692 [Grifola frondosa]|uniref:Uncharacterized protein n=1 Tax=Grifola frondosa TaxID=5627 RepID=A0A1C7LVI0_GRIFR|nr:hypothetical protein A0H81_11692 [Grifola frondosa]